MNIREQLSAEHQWLIQYRDELWVNLQLLEPLELDQPIYALAKAEYTDIWLQCEKAMHRYVMEAECAVMGDFE